MEHISTTTLIITLIVMVIISAYFSGSETGMMTLNRYRLRHMAKQGNRPAKRVEKLLRKPDRLISLVLIGNNLVNILASALGTIVGMRLYGDAGVAIATGVLTFVVLVFAEVLPKTIAALYPEKVAYPSSFLLAPLQVLMMPLVWLLNTITRILMRMMGIRTDTVISSALSKDELEIYRPPADPLPAWPHRALPRFAGRCHQHAARSRSLPSDDGEERVHKRDHAAGGR